jgi:hypothetical protein
MNAPALIPSETLPMLIDRATSALESARSSAEVLEARDMARVAYDAAKSAARMTRAKQAHDSLIVEVHRSQAHALAIRARAEMRLAEEYDAAQDRGEVAKGSTGRGDKIVDDHNDFKPATAADLGLRRDEIHEARKLRDAEHADPGAIRRALDGMIERGEEPTRAALKREVIERPAPPRRMDPRALWLWGRLKDFERESILSSDPEKLLAEMTEPMRADVRRLLPLVRGFIEEMEVRA